MAIQFVVEDGSIVSGATSYVTTAEFVQYHENMGNNISALIVITGAGTELDPYVYNYDAVKIVLNKATSYIDNTYTFIGAIVDNDQYLAWPRVDCVTRNGVEIDYNVIPSALKMAVCELAFELYGKQAYGVDSGIKSETYGAMSRTYKGTSSEKSYIAVDRMLVPFVMSGCRLQRVN